MTNTTLHYSHVLWSNMTSECLVLRAQSFCRQSETIGYHSAVVTDPPQFHTNDQIFP